jgi:hypothetical protein
MLKGIEVRIPAIESSYLEFDEKEKGLDYIHAM